MTDAIQTMNAFSVVSGISSMVIRASTPVHTQQMPSMEYATAQQELFIKTLASPAVQVDSQPSQEPVRNVTHHAKNVANN